MILSKRNSGTQQSIDLPCTFQQAYRYMSPTENSTILAERKLNPESKGENERN